MTAGWMSLRRKEKRTYFRSLSGPKSRKTSVVYANREMLSILKKDCKTSGQSGLKATKAASVAG
jgi:hypothetical protein